LCRNQTSTSDLINQSDVYINLCVTDDDEFTVMAEELIEDAKQEVNAT
jgi:hypothetical protein